MSVIQTTACRCGACGKDYEESVYQSIDVEREPELKEKVLSGEIFVSVCPHCGHRSLIQSPVIYSDRTAGILLCLTDRAIGLEDCPLTARRVESVGELVEKVKIFDAGLDDVALELCKYVTVQELGKDVQLRFLRLDGSDSDITFTYPLNGSMEMLNVGMNVYQDCCGIVARNPVLGQNATGLVRIDRAWVEKFIA